METVTSPAPRDVFKLLGRGVRVYRSMLISGTVMALVVFAVYGSARAYAATLVDDDQLIAAIFVDGGGLVLATVAALPWFRRTLIAVGADPNGLPTSASRITAMLAAAIVFWAGVLFGLRYLYGIPAIFVLLWYALFGYAVASTNERGLKALGTSVRIGQGRRWSIAALGIVLLPFNLAAAAPIGIEISPLTVVAAALLLVVTTNISMGAGANLYRWLVESEGS